VNEAPEEIAVRIQVLVLTDSKDSADLLSATLAEEPSIYLQAARMAFGEGAKALTRYEPHVVVVTDTIDDPAAAVEELDAVAPGVPVVALLPEGDLAGAQACNLAGARATLQRPIDRGNLLASIQQVYLKETRRRQHLTTALDGGMARPQRPRIIAVHGAKGGVGATTLACNLAVALHTLTQRRVTLVDADLLSGDTSVTCDVPVGRTISDLLPSIRDLDADFLDTLLAKHPTGVRLLLAPDQLQRAEAIRGDDMQRVLAALKPYADYTIVDTSSLFTPVTVAALDEADLIVLVVTPELVALRDAARFVQLARQLGYPAEKLLVAVNRANAGKGISTAMIEEQLQHRVGGAIPSDGRVMVECQNIGELIVASRPGHKVSRSIQDLARGVASMFGWDARVHRAKSATAGSNVNGAMPAAPGQNGAARSGGQNGTQNGAVPRRGGRLFPFFGRSLSLTPQVAAQQSKPD
jgi:pilus assembly protein CpaE